MIGRKQTLNHYTTTDALIVFLIVQLEMLHSSAVGPAYRK